MGILSAPDMSVCPNHPQQKQVFPAFLLSLRDRGGHDPEVRASAKRIQEVVAASLTYQAHAAFSDPKGVGGSPREPEPAVLVLSERPEPRAGDASNPRLYQ